MISTPLVICLAVASAAIVIVLMMWKPRRRLPARDAAWSWREATFGSMVLSFAASVGLARARAEQSGEGNADGGHNWHGSHLSHGPHGGFSDGGGGYGGGDGGGGGI
jgi:hypothetical protein